MSGLFHHEDGGHWYTKDGDPVYTVLKKDGTPRATHLGDAKKLALVPSVTGIIGVVAKPQLDIYKQTQAVMAALTLPRNPGESEEEFAKRVVKDAKEHMHGAADLGTQVHDWIESYIVGARKPFIAGMESSLASVADWVDANVGKLTYVEKSVASVHGYGGKVDLVGRLNDGLFAVVDWKTQFVKAGKEPNWYESWDLQLAAYAAAIEERPHATNWDIPWVDKRVSVVISTNPENPGCWAYEWNGREKAHTAFMSALTIWKYLNDYDPSEAIAKEVAA